MGLPDSVLGATWPSIYQEFDVPFSWAGIISVLVASMTVVSSLLSDRLTKKFGAGRVTTVSVAMTAAAIVGFSFGHSMISLCIWAIPYGLGAGSIDAALNNFVALHYASRHMSWLHCMWGVGASVGPYIMSSALKAGHNWNTGYRWISYIQIVITFILIMSLPLWKKQKLAVAESKDAPKMEKPIPLKEVVKIPGAKSVMLAFFCYCAVESTTGLWAASYLTLNYSVSAKRAAAFAALMFIGVTVGRALNGFLTFKLSDRQLIFGGASIVAICLIVLMLPLHNVNVALAAILGIGFGCAPIYPCIIHSTPAHFGAEKSQALIGVQMASAYVGVTVVPPIFGFLARHITIALFPYFLAVILVLMLVMYINLERTTKS